MLHARELCGCAGAVAEHGACERFQDQVLGAVGEHGNEHEHREAAGHGLLPDFGERLLEAWFGRHGLGRGRGFNVRAFQPAQRQQRDAKGQQRHGRCHQQQTFGRIGVEELARQPGRDGEACDHHHPDQGGCAASSRVGHALGQHHQQRCAAGAHAQAHQSKTQRGERDACRPVGCHPHRGQRGHHAANAQHRHAPDDPGRAAPAHVRSMAHARPRHLHQVVQGNQNAGQQRRQGQLHHHHAVERGGGQDHDGAQRGLHQTQPGNAAPAKRLHAIPRRAKALTIMPATNSGTPKPLYQSARAVGSARKRRISTP